MSVPPKPSVCYMGICGHGSASRTRLDPHWQRATMAAAAASRDASRALAGRCVERSKDARGPYVEPRDRERFGSRERLSPRGLAHRLMRSPPPSRPGPPPRSIRQATRWPCQFAVPPNPSSSTVARPRAQHPAAGFPERGGPRQLRLTRPAGLEPATKCLEGTCSVHELRALASRI